MQIPIVRIYDLIAADIITSTTTEMSSAIIRVATMSDSSHALLYIGGTRIVEAVPPSVRVTAIDIALEDSPWAKAWRMDSLNQKDREKICAFAVSARGAPYSGYAAILSAFGASAAGGAGCFCSRLVAAAYDSAGIALTDAGWGATYPGQIEKRENRNANLRCLGWLKNPLLADCDDRLQRASR
jgi:uncharacterized protein YycO